jgi:5,10-methenyltetrahydrofolate synthetase
MLHELQPDRTVGVDPEQARDVARWRKAERARLISARLAQPAEARAAQTGAMISRLDALVAPMFAPIVSLYWPIRGEPDLRHWMATLFGRGVRVALPVAVATGQPLLFREWRPNARLERGLWKIPYPADGAELVPTVVIAPVVGFDGSCYRLGYGGGFFDRTLARLNPKPTAIGVGYADAALATIYPQPHDVPMDRVVTGEGTLERATPAVGPPGPTPPHPR